MKNALPPVTDSARLLAAVHTATRKLSRVGEIDAVMRDVLEICGEAVGAEGGTIYIHDPATRTLRFRHVLPEAVAARIEMLDIPDDFGVAGRVFRTGRAEVSEFTRRERSRPTDIERKAGILVRTMITVPLAISGMPPIGVVQLINKRNGNFNEADEAVLDTIGDVAALAVTNARLLEQQTQVAALEGMGRAAHDLANKAGVLVTFLEDFRRNLSAFRACVDVEALAPEARFHLEMLEGSFEDVFAPYSERVYRYARLINDLAAGKPLEPKRKLAQLAAVVQESAQYLESPARAAHVQIRYDLQEDAPPVLIDELYVGRIVENLVGNAIKAVAETASDEWLEEHRGDTDEHVGHVTIRTLHAEGSHVLEIQDTGPGMAPGTVRAILSGQAGTRWERSAGSGLGTKVVRELVAALGGKLSIHSRLGEGTTFRIELPG
jgi:signal transduction histidine kinase